MLLVVLFTALFAVAECESWLKRSLEYQEIPILSRSATMISGRGFRPGKRSSLTMDVPKYAYGRRPAVQMFYPPLPWGLPIQTVEDSS
uniref:Uncharacterized protein n=1 Tax=Syphacia muris TaxID=451379 RepID=A0A0N5AEZ8_9BILA